MSDLSVVGGVRFKKQCKARCAASGVRCKLLEHAANVVHRSERGAFLVTAEEGQNQFILAAVRDEMAVSQNGTFCPIEALREGF